MVTTRRRQKQQEEESAAKDREDVLATRKKAEPNKDEDDKDATEPLDGDVTDKKRKSLSRKIRKEQGVVLRSKKLGLIRISSGTSPAKKPSPAKKQQMSSKIVFGESDNHDEGNDAMEEAANQKDKDNNDDQGEDGDDDDDDAPESAPTTTTRDDAKAEEEDDDDDDAVEQVDSKVARNIALAERQQERTTRNAQATKKKRKRKTREGPSRPKEDEEDLDDDFFAELQAQKSAMRKAENAKPEHTIPKHTIFQSDDEPFATPMEVNPGMELVVLGENDNSNSGMSLALTTIEPSETALFHSRRHVLDGSDIISAKQALKQRKTGLAPPEANWKRSKKMNRLLFGQRGKPAPNFVVNKAVKAYKF